MAPHWRKPHGFDGKSRFIVSDHETIVLVEGCDDGGARA
jgi:hypothetical protein